MMYLNRLLGYGSIVKVGWTLCLEVQFYLVFVFVLRISRCAPTRQIASMATSFFFVLAIWSIGTASGAIPLTIRGLFVRHWYMFYLGIVAHRAIDSPSFRWLLAGTIVVSFGAPIDQTVAASVTALLLVVAGRFCCLSYPLGGPALQYLGRLSYSFYLIHPLVGNPFLRALVYKVGGPM
jgi:peptidoglycan/LPS O-acetylase OafA/YrhL